MAKRKDLEPDRARVPVRLLACDDLGLLQGVQAPDLNRFEDAKVVSRWGEADRRQNAARCLAVSASTEQEQNAGPSGSFLVAVGRTAGRISVLDGQTGQLRDTITCDTSSSGSSPPEGNVAGLHFLTSQTPDRPQLLSCTHGGSVDIHSPALHSDDENWERLAHWTVPGKVSSMAVSEDESCMAVGCEGSELNIWDVQSQQRTFLAKSAKPNRIGLVDLPFCSTVAFVPGSGASQVLIGTGKSKLRLYDTKHGRRPVLDLTFGEARITSLAAEPNGKRVWVANAAGKVEVLDLQAGKMDGAVKGAIGSVRSLALHPTEPLLASVGLDRFVRVHSTTSRKQLCAVYLKQQLNGVSFCPASHQEEAKECAQEQQAAAGRHGDRRRKQAKSSK